MRRLIDVLADLLHRLGHLAVTALLMQTVKTSAQRVDNQRVFFFDPVILLLQRGHAPFQLDELVIQPIPAEHRAQDHGHRADDLSQPDDLCFRRLHLFSHITSLPIARQKKKLHKTMQLPQR